MSEPMNPQENQPVVVDENHVIAERREKLKEIREAAKANNSAACTKKRHHARGALQSLAP